MKTTQKICPQCYISFGEGRDGGRDEICPACKEGWKHFEEK